MEQDKVVTLHDYTCRQQRKYECLTPTSDKLSIKLFLVLFKYSMYKYLTIDRYNLVKICEMSIYSVVISNSVFRLFKNYRHVKISHI